MMAQRSLNGFLVILGLVSCIFLGASRVCLAQMSPEEAAQRLAERKAAEAAAATQPSSISVADLRDLRAQLAALKKENAELSAKVKKLSDQVEAGKAAASADAARSSAVKEITVGMTEDELRAFAKTNGWILKENVEDEVTTDRGVEKTFTRVRSFGTGVNEVAKDTCVITVVAGKITEIRGDDKGK